jgi:hypothetical protein
MRSEEEFTFLRLRERNPVFFLSPKGREVSSPEDFIGEFATRWGTEGCSGLLRTES